MAQVLAPAAVVVSPNLVAPPSIMPLGISSPQSQLPLSASFTSASVFSNANNNIGFDTGSSGSSTTGSSSTRHYQNSSVSSSASSVVTGASLFSSAPLNSARKSHRRASSATPGLVPTNDAIAMSAALTHRQIQIQNGFRPKMTSSSATSAAQSHSSIVIRPYAFQSTPNLLPSALGSLTNLSKTGVRDDSSLSLSSASSSFFTTPAPMTARPISAFIPPTVFSSPQSSKTRSSTDVSTPTPTSKSSHPSRYHRPQSRLSTATPSDPFSSPTRRAVDGFKPPHYRADSNSSANTAVTSASVPTAAPASAFSRPALLDDNRTAAAASAATVLVGSSTSAHESASASSKPDSSSSANSSKRYRRRSLANTSSLHIIASNTTTHSSSSDDRPTIVMVGSDSAADTQKSLVTSDNGDYADQDFALIPRPASSHARISSNEDSVIDSVRSSSRASDAHTLASLEPNQLNSLAHPLGQSTGNPDGNDLPTDDGDIITKNDSVDDTNGKESTVDTSESSVVSPPPPPRSKGMKSRLRRALSFGSAADLQLVSNDKTVVDPQCPTVTSRKSLYSEDRTHAPELTALDLDIAARQEAAGLGDNIYSSQPGFSISTDNVSVSSTASSASMVLRKMGRGMKRSTRSLRSLFRPKSLIGLSATSESSSDKTATGATPMSGSPSVELSTTAVQAVRPVFSRGGAGGTETSTDTANSSISAISALSRGLAASRSTDIVSRNIPDLERPDGSSSSNSSGRSVKKGILKHTMSVPSMSSYQAMQAMGQAGVHDGARPRVGLRRPSEFCLGGGYHHSNRSVPGPMRNISFNSQVQFYDVWSSMDYDRRGEIATCNRLTPDLAQQIKEELNSLKMEMEVHEMSRPNTQFF